MAKTPLAMVSSPRVGPTFSSWSGVGFEARRQAAGPEDVDQVLDLLRLEPLRAALDDARVADLRVDHGRRHDQVVEQDRELVLEGAPSSGRCSRGQLAEPRRALAVELEAGRPAGAARRVGSHLAEILAGDFLAGPVEVAEDPGLDPPGCHLLLADDRVVRVWGRSGRRAAIRLGLYSIRYEVTVLSLWGSIEGQRSWRSLRADAHDVARFLAVGVLAGQLDVDAGVDVLLPGLRGIARAGRP